LPQFLDSFFIQINDHCFYETMVASLRFSN